MSEDFLAAALPVTLDSWFRIRRYRQNCRLVDYVYGEPSQPVVISDTCLTKKEEWAVVESCCSMVRRLHLYHLRDDEISREAIMMSWLSTYDGQVGNGGHLQVAENIGWNPRGYATVRAALLAIGAHQHMELFERAESILVWGGPASMYNRVEDKDVSFDSQRLEKIGAPLCELDSAWYALDRGPDNLTSLMTRWIRTRPDLQVLSIPDMMLFAERCRDSLPDLAERRQRSIEQTSVDTKVTCAFADLLGYPANPVKSQEINFQFEGKYRGLRAYINRTLYLVVVTETESILLAEDKSTVVHRLPTAELLQRFPYQGHERYLWQGDV